MCGEGNRSCLNQQIYLLYYNFSLFILLYLCTHTLYIEFTTRTPPFFNQHIPFFIAYFYNFYNSFIIHLVTILKDWFGWCAWKLSRHSCNGIKPTRIFHTQLLRPHGTSVTHHVITMTQMIPVFIIMIPFQNKKSFQKKNNINVKIKILFKDVFLK